MSPIEIDVTIETDVVVIIRHDVNVNDHHPRVDDRTIEIAMEDVAAAVVVVVVAAMETVVVDAVVRRLVEDRDRHAIRVPPEARAEIAVTAALAVVAQAVAPIRQAKYYFTFL